MEQKIILLMDLSDLRLLITETVNSCLADWSDSLDKKSYAKADEYLTRQQLCKLLQITPPTVYSYLRKGQLKAYKVGGKNMFKKSEVLARFKPIDYKISK